MTAETVTRMEVHPDWCDEDDHGAVAADLGDELTHYALVAEQKGWVVTIEQPVQKGGWPVVTVTHHWFDEADEGYVQTMKMSGPEARSVAAMITAAADRMEIHRR